MLIGRPREHALPREVHRMPAICRPEVIHLAGNERLDVRGLGLMIGVELSQPVAKSVLKGLLDRGVVANAVGDTVIRFLPRNAFA